ncbi:hypothetical protein LCGC14_3158380, partial [marine sediment metagenome]
MRIILYILILTMSFQFNRDDLNAFAEKPHLIGRLIGKNKLKDLHSKWIINVWMHGIPLQAHRNSYKTTAVTEVGSIWWLLFHPSDRIAIYRKPYTEAARILNAIRKYFDMQPLIKLFEHVHGFVPKLIQKKEDVLTFNFKRTVTREGSLNAYGIENIRTGTHFEKAIADDFVTLLDRTSKAKREHTKQSVMELVTNIMEPGQKVGFVGTPWAISDAWSLD